MKNTFAVSIVVFLLIFVSVVIATPTNIDPLTGELITDGDLSSTPGYGASWIFVHGGYPVFIPNSPSTGSDSGNGENTQSNNNFGINPPGTNYPLYGPLGLPLEPVNSIEPQSFTGSSDDPKFKGVLSEGLKFGPGLVGYGFVSVDTPDGVIPLIRPADLLGGLPGVENVDNVYMDENGDMYQINTKNGNQFLEKFSPGDKKLKTIHDAIDKELKITDDTDHSKQKDELAKIIEEKADYYDSAGYKIIRGILTGRAYASAFTAIGDWFWKERPRWNWFGSEFGATLANIDQVVLGGLCETPSISSPSTIAFGPGGFPAVHIEGYIINMKGRIVDCEDNSACEWFKHGLTCNDDKVCVNPDNSIYKSDVNEYFHVITFQVTPKGILNRHKDSFKMKLLFDGKDSQPIDLNLDSPGGVEVKLKKETPPWGATSVHPIIRRTRSAHHETICIKFLGNLQSTYNQDFLSTLSDAGHDNMLCNSFYSSDENPSGEPSWLAEAFSFGAAGGYGGGESGGSVGSTGSDGSTEEGLPEIRN